MFLSEPLWVFLYLDYLLIPTRKSDVWNPVIAPPKIVADVFLSPCSDNNSKEFVVCILSLYSLGLEVFSFRVRDSSESLTLEG